MPVPEFVSNSVRRYSKMQSVIQQLLARGARLIILCNTGDRDLAQICAASPACRLIQAPLFIFIFGWIT